MAGTFWRRTRGLLAVAAFGLLALAGMPSLPPQDCAVPTHFYDTEPTLPKTTAALVRGQTVSIVVLGGASTLGTAAGDPTLAWPARLMAILSSRFPKARVQVDNRAVARQTAEEVVSHLLHGVMAVQPTLVIWEAGTTDAVNGTDLDEFRQTLQSSIDQLRASGSEVMFMDIQFARQTHAIINFDGYESILREVTDANEVPLFRRYDIMRHWADGGAFDLMTENHDALQRIASHLYDCIGRAVADFVVRGIPPDTPPPPALSGSPR